MTHDPELSQPKNVVLNPDSDNTWLLCFLNAQRDPNETLAGINDDLWDEINSVWQDYVEFGKERFEQPYLEDGKWVTPYYKGDEKIIPAREAFMKILGIDFSKAKNPIPPLDTFITLMRSISNDHKLNPAEIIRAIPEVISYTTEIMDNKMAYLDWEILYFGYSTTAQEILASSPERLLE